MTRLHFLGLLILLSVAATAADGNTQEQQEIVPHHSLIPPFISEWWQGGLPHWDFGASAVVTDKYIRVAPDKQSRIGWVWNDASCHLGNWEATLSFRIHSKRNPGADGLAFWYVNQPYRYDARNNEHVHQSHIFGNRADFLGIGVIFDTYDNDGQRDNPLVAVIRGQGDKNQNWQHETDLVNQSEMRCVYEFRNTPPGEVVNARIVFSAQTLQVYLSNTHDVKETFCGSVSNLDLPVGYFFGVTASTGHLADNHDIHGLTVTAAPEAVTNEAKKLFDAQPKAAQANQVPEGQTP